MRTKFFTLILVFLTILNANTQSLSDARKAFDRYEYKTAAEYFDHLIKNDKKLELEDLKRITYSYYTLGDYKECKPYSDSIISFSNVEEMFYLINGDVNKGLFNFSKAIDSYEKYQSKGGEIDVRLKIESCKEIPNWDDEVYVKFNQAEQNSSLADFVAGNSKYGVVHFTEKGYDENNYEINLKEENSDRAELLLTTPILYRGNERASIKLKDSKFTSITSMSILPNENKAIITASYPLKKDKLLKVPNLYWAKFDTVSYELYDLQAFEYSGLKDSSSTAHATVNASGDQMVFTKIKSTESTSNLYFSQLSNGSWSKPLPLNSINSNKNEIYPLFSGDSILTFSSDGRVGYGGLDIYSAVYKGGETSEVTHLKAPINSVRDDFNMTYLSQDSALFASNRSGGSGDDDVYFIQFEKEEVIVEPVDTIEQVVEWETKSVYFRFDKFNLEESLPSEKINDLKVILSENKECKIHLIGFTDNIGTSTYNKKLGMKRAVSVEKALIEKGFKSDQITLTSMGEKNQPNDCGSNCKGKDHELNRVVQIKLKCE